MKVPSASAVAAKFIEVTPDRARYYAQGVASPKKDWAEETAAAESRFEEGIKDSITRKAFGKGVTRAGTAKWKAAATTKGVERYGPGVEASKDAYQKGISPFLSALEGLTLPEKYKTGDKRNNRRVDAVTELLHATKLAQT